MPDKDITVDKAKFDAILRRMIDTKPAPFKDMAKKRKPSKKRRAEKEK